MKVRKRFWVEVLLATVTAVLAGVTAVVPDWIEEGFKVDPDAGSGALEIGIVVALAAVSVAFGLPARHELRSVSPDRASG